MQSGLFKLSLNDLAKGLIMAIIAALLTYFSNPSLDMTAIDWGYVIKVSLTTCAAYLGKNLLTDSEGRIGGVVKL